MDLHNYTLLIGYYRQARLIGQNGWALTPSLPPGPARHQGSLAPKTLLHPPVTLLAPTPRTSKHSPQHPAQGIFALMPSFQLGIPRRRTQGEGRSEPAPQNSQTPQPISSALGLQQTHHVLPRVLRDCKLRACLFLEGDPDSLCTSTLCPQAQQGWCQREENPPPSLPRPLNAASPTRFAV